MLKTQRQCHDGQWTHQRPAEPDHDGPAVFPLAVGVADGPLAAT
jgi:hypothetical protein